MNNINELRAAEERAYREHLNALTTAADIAHDPMRLPGDAGRSAQGAEAAMNARKNRYGETK
jgi:hypothetical protein